MAVLGHPPSPQRPEGQGRKVLERGQQRIAADVRLAGHGRVEQPVLAEKLKGAEVAHLGGQVLDDEGEGGLVVQAHPGQGEGDRVLGLGPLEPGGAFHFHPLARRDVPGRDHQAVLAADVGPAHVQLQPQQLPAAGGAEPFEGLGAFAAGLGDPFDGLLRREGPEPQGQLAQVQGQEVRHRPVEPFAHPPVHVQDAARGRIQEEDAVVDRVVDRLEMGFAQGLDQGRRRHPGGGFGPRTHGSCTSAGSMNVLARYDDALNDPLQPVARARKSFLRLRHQMLNRSR